MVSKSVVCGCYVILRVQYKHIKVLKKIINMVLTLKYFKIFYKNEKYFKRVCVCVYIYINLEGSSDIDVGFIRVVIV